VEYIYPTTFQLYEGAAGYVGRKINVRDCNLFSATDPLPATDRYNYKEETWGYHRDPSFIEISYFSQHEIRLSLKEVPTPPVGWALRVTLPGGYFEGLDVDISAFEHMNASSRIRVVNLESSRVVFRRVYDRWEWTEQVLNIDWLEDWVLPRLESGKNPVAEKIIDPPEEEKEKESVYAFDCFCETKKITSHLRPRFLYIPLRKFIMEAYQSGKLKEYEESEHLKNFKFEED
jgi:hypothetical protein